MLSRGKERIISIGKHAIALSIVEKRKYKGRAIIGPAFIVFEFFS